MTHQNLFMTLRDYRFSKNSIRTCCWKQYKGMLAATSAKVKRCPTKKTLTGVLVNSGKFPESVEMESLLAELRDSLQILRKTSVSWCFLHAFSSPGGHCPSSQISSGTRWSRCFSNASRAWSKGVPPFHHPVVMRPWLSIETCELGVWPKVEKMDVGPSPHPHGPYRCSPSSNPQMWNFNFVSTARNWREFVWLHVEPYKMRPSPNWSVDWQTPSGSSLTTCRPAKLIRTLEVEFVIWSLAARMTMVCTPRKRD